jgi:hypothetical protein
VLIRLTQCSRILPEKLRVLRLAKKFPAFCGTQRSVNNTISKSISLHASILKSVVESTDIRVADEILTKFSVISAAYSRYFTLESTGNDAYETIPKTNAQK